VVILSEEEQVDQEEQVGAESTGFTTGGQPGTDRVLTIRVPGSTANLGPAFDTVAVAVKLYLNVTIEIQPPHKSGYAQIVPVSPIAQQLPLDNTNYLLRVFQKLWPQDPKILACLKFTIDTDLPIGSGLGASAAATVAAATGVMALCGQQLQKGAIFAQCAELEGYANSTCASVFGGFTICGPGSTPDDYLARKIIWPENWRLIATIPPYSLSSKKTRRLLPASVSHSDAIYNVQRSSLLIEAVAAGDNEAMKSALRDKLHEPFQAKQVPEFSEVKKTLQGCDVLGTVLSGGGPSIITVVDVEHEDEVYDRLRRWADSQKHPSQVMILPLDDDGLVVTCE
jgi:homoserine kinase